MPEDLGKTIQSRIDAETFNNEDKQEGKVRIQDPSKYVRFFRRPTKTDGVSVIIGVKKDGKSELQAVRFDKTKGITEEDAKDWIASKENLVKAIKGK